MKKALRVLFIAILAVICYTTVANAASGEKLIEYVTKGIEIAGKEYRFSEKDILKVKKYLASNPITEEQERQIITKSDKIVAIMKEEGVADPTKLSTEKKHEVFGIAQEVAGIVDINLTYDSTNERIVPYKDGVKLDEIPLDNTKLVQTGVNYAIYLNLAVVAVITIATVVVKSRKSRVNA